MTAILMPAGRLRYHATINGAYGPAVGYKLHTYEAGTTTPKATYSTPAATTPLANPIILDALGECAPFGFGAYKLVLKDTSDAEVWTLDNVNLSTDVIDSEWCGTAGGTADAITLSPAEAITDYTAGQRFAFVAASANTGPVTVAISGLPTRALTKNGNTALAANDLVQGRIHVIQDDGVRLQLLSDPRATLTVTAPDLTDDSSRVVTSAWVKDLTATETRAGLIEIATAGEAPGGTGDLAITAGNLKAGLNASGSAPIYAARAWVNFNGTGTVAIRASGNVSSITDNGTGSYTINFSTALSDANYAPVVNSYGADGARNFVNSNRHETLGASSYEFLTYRADGSSGVVAADSSIISAAIYR